MATSAQIAANQLTLSTRPAPRLKKAGKLAKTMRYATANRQKVLLAGEDPAQFDGLHARPVAKLA